VSQVEYEEAEGQGRGGRDSFELLRGQKRPKLEPKVEEASQGPAKAVRVNGQRKATGKGDCATWEPLPTETYTGKFHPTF